MFYFVPTHSLMKRARSFISIFCCSARLVHSRIFCAFSCGIIFSGAVAFIGPGNCADAACANIATPKNNAKRNAIGRCRCIYVTQRPVLTKIIAEEPRVQRDCVMPTMSALGQKQTFAPQKVMSALPPIADICSYGWNVHTKRPDFNIFAVKRRKTAHQRSRAYRRFAKRPQASSCVGLLVNETAACQPGNVGNIAGLLWYSGDCDSRTCDGDFVYHPCSEPCPYEPTHDHKKADTRERVRISYLQ